MTEERAERLRAQADRCRRLARLTTDREVSQQLLELAAEFDVKAAAEDADGLP